MKVRIIRPMIEILSIMILFYTNLLMGQFLKTSLAVDGHSIWAGIINIITPQNILIGLVGATLAFILVELVNQK